MPMKKDPKKKDSKGQDTRAKRKKIVISSMEVETSGSGGEDPPSGNKDNSKDPGNP